MKPELTAQQQQQVLQLLTDALGAGVRVSMFGSRARGDARPFSDLDLMLESDSEIPWCQLALAAELCADSELPFAVDISDRQRMSEQFQQRIAPELTVLGTT